MAAGYVSPGMAHKAMGYGAIAGSAGLGYSAYKGYRNRRKSKPSNQSNSIREIIWECIAQW